MSASKPQPKQSDTPPANVKWLVAIITGVLVVGTAVALDLREGAARWWKSTGSRAETS